MSTRLGRDQGNIAGMTASRYREAGKETDIVLMLSEKIKRN